MLDIRCPNCEDMVFLQLADWDDFTGSIELGKEQRLGLVCLQCRGEFILQFHVGQVIREYRHNRKKI